jgi:transcription elongation factor Elf1
MDLVDDKYIGLIACRLDKFSKKNSNLYNFRCPICGDSKKNKTKARGFIYSVKNNTNYKCHNCGISISFSNFLKQIDSSLYKEYSLEKFKNGTTGKNFSTPEPKFKFKKPVFKTKLDLPLAETNQTAKEYLEGRKLDPKKFFYAEKFKEWVNQQKKTFDQIVYDEARIIIPLYYKKTLIGFQGRSLSKNSIKYITITLDDSAPKIYGYDNLNLNEIVYVVEGPFDSTFISNSIAMCGSDVNFKDLNISHLVYVYDNEPRNREIHLRMEKIIDQNIPIVIWPSTITQKDINEMVLSGLDVQFVIESNTYSGLEAKLKFNTWKKI